MPKPSADTAPDTEAANVAGWQTDQNDVHYLPLDSSPGCYLVKKQGPHDFRVFRSENGLVELVGAEEDLDAARTLAERHRGGDPATAN
jgi:hypothetical protein